MFLIFGFGYSFGLVVVVVRCLFLLFLVSPVPALRFFLVVRSCLLQLFYVGPWSPLLSGVVCGSNRQPGGPRGACRVAGLGGSSVGCSLAFLTCFRVRVDNLLFLVLLSVVQGVMVASLLLISYILQRVVAQSG